MSPTRQPWLVRYSAHSAHPLRLPCLNRNATRCLPHDVSINKRRFLFLPRLPVVALRPVTLDFAKCFHVSMSCRWLNLGLVCRLDPRVEPITRQLKEPTSSMARSLRCTAKNSHKGNDAVTATYPSVRGDDDTVERMPYRDNTSWNSQTPKSVCITERAAW
jgi:hypothetical protein